MKRDWSGPPACWSWEVPPLDLAVPILSDVADARVVDSAAWRFAQFHQGRCALCGQILKLVVDHDHWSGLVRGLLCEGCNVTEGRPWTTDVMGFAGYRRRHPAAILGYYEPYRLAGTCVAFAHARSRDERESRKMRNALRRLDGQIGLLIKWTAPEAHASRWGKATQRVESLWRGVSVAACADPPAVNAHERLATLRDLLTVVRDIAFRFDPAAGQMVDETVGEICRLLRT